KALRIFGAPLLNVTEEDFRNPKTFYQIGLPPSRIDLLAGLERMDFAACWERRKMVQMDDLALSYIAATDLIVNKEITGRPQDLVDVEHLRKKLEMFGGHSDLVP